MTVYFIGAGPGDPDLITVKGRRLVESCNIASMPDRWCRKLWLPLPPRMPRWWIPLLTLDDIMAIIARAEPQARMWRVSIQADPSLYGAIAEQIRRLREMDIDYQIIPGCRPMPPPPLRWGRADYPRSCPEHYPDADGDEIFCHARRRGAGKLCPHKGNAGDPSFDRNLREIERVLTPYYGADCPVVVAYRVGWPDQEFIRGTLEDIRLKVRDRKITRTALIFVGPALQDVRDFRDSHFTTRIMSMSCGPPAAILRTAPLPEMRQRSA